MSHRRVSALLGSTLAAALLASCSAGAPAGTSGPAAPASAGSSAAASGSPADAAAGTASAPVAPATGNPNDCPSWDGKPGVVRTFCTGPGKATATVLDGTYSIGGGECEVTSNAFAFNAGVLSGDDMAPGVTRPEYVGFAQIGGGDAALAMVFNGKGYVVPSAKVTIAPDKKSGKVSGVAIAGGGDVTVTFTC